MRRAGLILLFSVCRRKSVHPSIVRLAHGSGRTDFSVRPHPVNTPFALSSPLGGRVEVPLLTAENPIVFRSFNWLTTQDKQIFSYDANLTHEGRRRRRDHTLRLERGLRNQTTFWGTSFT
jgi:hypothetical protein